MKTTTCIVETPKSSSVKIDFDHQLGCFKMNKVLPAGLVFPFDFGFIPGTKGEDGDPLDVIIFSESTYFPGCAIDCKIVGAIKALQTERDDSQMRNDRYLAIPEKSVLFEKIVQYSQVPLKIRQELEQFFTNYNLQAGKKFDPLKWVGPDIAITAIEKAKQSPELTKLIQLFLPLYDKAGNPFPEKYFTSVKEQLVNEYGGVSIYSKATVAVFWKDRGKSEKDDWIVYEVMAGSIDISYWKSFKAKLLPLFQQDKIIVRKLDVGLL